MASVYDWHLEAWAVFSNHYHFVGHSPREASTADTLRKMLGELHLRLSVWVNRLDGELGRQVWHKYWETRLTYQRSYLARLQYVHQNPVKHGLVRVAIEYPWCSAGWLERTASTARIESLRRFKIDRIEVADEFDPSHDW
jgi:putative transposase